MRIVQLVGVYPGWDGEPRTVPPRGYGGIEWVVATLTAGLAGLGHTVFLMAAPGSAQFWDRRYGGLVTTIEYTEYREATSWLKRHSADYDIVHSHISWNIHSPWWQLRGAERAGRIKWVHTWHVKDNIHPIDTGNIPNVVCVSRSQRDSCGFHGPVIPLPVNPDWYPLESKKRDYLLYMGLVAEWKGIEEAIELARRARRRLIVAGPKVSDRFDDLLNRSYVEYRGVVGGEERLELLQRARFVLCLYNSRNKWREPGATVVSEANACGTPVIAFPNGCLPEIIEDGVNGVMASNVEEAWQKMNQFMVSPVAVRNYALRHWAHIDIAAHYVEVYNRLLAGETWQ